MTAPQIIMMCIAALAVFGVCAEKDPKTALANFSFFVFFQFIIWWGGFWS